MWARYAISICVLTAMIISDSYPVTKSMISNHKWITRIKRAVDAFRHAAAKGDTAPSSPSKHELKTMRLVSGNVACDLDSAATAIAYAAYLARKQPMQITIPVLNIWREELEVHTEVTYWINQILKPVTSISEIAFFRDDIIKLAKMKHNVSVILVDHNIIEAPVSEIYNVRVEGVIDHHALLPNTPLPEHNIIETVASGATLLSRYIHTSPDASPQLLTEELAKMLYGAILIDSNNLHNPHKTTQADSEQEQLLREKFNWTLAQRDEWYAGIEHAKGDVSSLTIKQMLIKDYKPVPEAHPAIGLSTIPISLAEFDDAFAKEGKNRFDDMLNYNDIDVLIVRLNDGHVTVYGHNDEQVERVMRVLDDDKELDIRPDHQHTPPSLPPQTRVYFQTNTAVTRKQYLPVLKAHFSKPSHDSQSQ